MVEGLKHTRYVYHYTSIETLFSLLERYRKDKKKDGLIFRASNIYKLNDPKEMEVGYDIVNAFLCEYEKNEMPKEYWLHEIACNKANEKKCKEEYFVGTKNYIIDAGIIPYTISFSARRDYLPMWSLYGKSGQGVCLKFDAFKMIDENLDGQVGFVAYDMKSGMRIMKEVIPYMYKLYVNDYKNRLNELTIDNKIRELATICLAASPFLKYRDYQYEKEFRLTYYKYYGMTDRILTSTILNFHQSVSDIASFVEIPISTSALKEIILGPNLDKKSMREIIRKEIKACKLDVNVSISKVPFKI
ncbi:MAG: DUF2971 domain-containing protein [Prevotella sp.]|nr:DUF2971 domain-containing protein [Prevotella sp.]